MIGIADDRLSEAPVENHRFAMPTHHDIGRFNIAMDDSATVGVVNGLADGDEGGEEGVQFQSLIRCQFRGGQLAVQFVGALPQCLSGNSPHDVERLSIGQHPVSVDGDDARVIKSTGDFAFRFELLHAIGNPRMLLLQELDRGVAFEHFIATAIDGSQSSIVNEFAEDKAGFDFDLNGRWLPVFRARDKGSFVREKAIQSPELRDFDFDLRSQAGALVAEFVDGDVATVLKFFFPLVEQVIYLVIGHLGCLLLALHEIWSCVPVRLGRPKSLQVACLYLTKKVGVSAQGIGKGQLGVAPASFDLAGTNAHDLGGFVLRKFVVPE